MLNDFHWPSGFRRRPIFAKKPVRADRSDK